MQQLMRYRDTKTKKIVKIWVPKIYCPGCGDDLIQDKIYPDCGVFYCIECDYFHIIDTQGQNRCRICYRNSPNIKEPCLWSPSSCVEMKMFRKYNPEECTICEWEKEKPEPLSPRWTKCTFCRDGSNFEPKHHWQAIINRCPQCNKPTVISDGKVWLCGCGFAYELNFTGEKRIQTESTIETPYQNNLYRDGGIDDQDLRDDLNFLEEFVRLASLDNNKDDLYELAEKLPKLLAAVKFRIDSIKKPQLQRFCPYCHHLLVAEKNRNMYFWKYYCDNPACRWEYDEQRGVEEDWKDNHKTTGWNWELLDLPCRTLIPVIEHPLLQLLKFMIEYEYLLSIPVIRTRCERILQNEQ